MKLYLDAVGITSSGGAVVLWNLLYHLVRVAPEIQIEVFLLPGGQRSYRSLVESSRIKYREVGGPPAVCCGSRFDCHCCAGWSDRKS